MAAAAAAFVVVVVVVASSKAKPEVKREVSNISMIRSLIDLSFGSVVILSLMALMMEWSG